MAPENELTEDDLDYWNERAAIYEYEGNLPRPLAELEAMEDLKKRRGE